MFALIPLEQTGQSELLHSLFSEIFGPRERTAVNYWGAPSLDALIENRFFLSRTLCDLIPRGSERRDEIILPRG